MATTKKKSSSTRRKPGASKAPRKRKRVSGTASATPATMAISGVKFTKSTCHKTKTDAKKTAEGKRKRGYNARVVKSASGGYCVYSRRRARA